MARYKEYNWTIDSLRARVDSLRQLAEGVGAPRKASFLKAISDALEKAYESGAAYMLVDAANDYEEICDGIAVYLTQTAIRARERDLVLETLIKAATRRFNDIERVLSIYSPQAINDDALSVLKDVITMKTNVTEESAAKC